MPEFKLPKLSEFLKPFAEIESNIRTQIESATGLPLPMGVAEVTKNVIESIEATVEGTLGGSMPLSLPVPGVQQQGQIEVTRNIEESQGFSSPGEEKEEVEKKEKKELSFEV